jgi:hypothetical protein
VADETDHSKSHGLSEEQTKICHFSMVDIPVEFDAAVRGR